MLTTSVKFSSELQDITAYQYTGREIGCRDSFIFINWRDEHYLMWYNMECFRCF